MADEERGGWVFEGELYNNPETCNRRCSEKQWLFDQVYEDLHDMIPCFVQSPTRTSDLGERRKETLFLP